MIPCDAGIMAAQKKAWLFLSVVPPRLGAGYFPPNAGSLPFIFHDLFSRQCKI